MCDIFVWLCAILRDFADRFDDAVIDPPEEDGAEDNTTFIYIFYLKLQNIQKSRIFRIIIHKKHIFRSFFVFF